MILLGNDLTSVWIALLCGVIGLIFVVYLMLKIIKKDRGNNQMCEISDLIHEGAMAFLYREYITISFFAIGIAGIIFFTIARKTALAFLAGSFFSIIAGYLGMQIATRSNDRTAQASSKSFQEGMDTAFPGGAVMGMSVAGLGLLGVSVIYLIFIWHAGLKQADFLLKLTEATNLIVGFSLGASLVALFGRVGGGIYTKAADVGADLVGKVEAGIPEDDPRNPAVIADNVGDNVGDVAGMGADLFESYVGAIISAVVVAMSSQNTMGVMLTFLLAGWGICSSIGGFFFVKMGKEGADAQKALRNGMIFSALFLAVGAFLLTGQWYKDMALFGSVISGLLAGILVGFTAEYYTSGKSVIKIAEASKTGPATNFIAGISTGMYSTAFPMFIISATVLIAYSLGGIFGVALSAIGMLSITGMTVAVDAYGPIADNAAGIAEMAKMGPEVRKRTEKLDSVGNTTAAIGKGFAIGSAALTALALFTAYAQTVGLEMIDIMKAKVVAGLFLGGTVPFIFSAATMKAVGRAAFKIVEEVRRQFKEIPGLMEGNARPDSATCVDITTKSALREMIAPGIMAVIFPVVIGVILGREALGGFLAGSLVTGVPLAILLANAGGAWDNAKKYIEEGNLGGKGSDVHKAAVIGDTVGDPFKDTSGPSLNILLKLMAIVSLVFSPLIISIREWLLFKF